MAPIAAMTLRRWVSIGPSNAAYTTIGATRALILRILGAARRQADRRARALEIPI